MAADLERYAWQLRGRRRAHRLLRAFLQHPSLWAIVHYRIGRAGHDDDRRLLRAIHGMAALPIRLLTGVEIPVSARIGAGVSLEHYGNTIINGDAVIGRNVTLGQGILIGGVHYRGVPRIGDDVVIGARAILLGPVAVGDGARVGAGAVVVKDVPAGATVVGNPARIVGSREA